MSNLAAPTSLRFEHRTDAGPVLGIGTATPRLSWQIPTAAAGSRQAAYEVEITTGTAQAYTVQSPDQILVPWPGDPLKSRESASVRVRVRDNDDWSEWSEPATVEAGLLGEASGGPARLAPDGRTGDRGCADGHPAPRAPR